jgi:hypothetical protein
LVEPLLLIRPETRRRDFPRQHAAEFIEEVRDVPLCNYATPASATGDEDAHFRRDRLAKVLQDLS